MAKENKYLQIEFGTGNLFAYSKEEKEGYEEHKSSKGNVSYRAYFKEGIYGIYRGATVRDTKFGKEISLHMIDVDGGNVYISFPLFDQSKNIAIYAEALITLMPAMQMNFVYRVFPYAMEKKGTEYKNYGVSIKHADMHERTVREDYPLERLTYTYEKEGVLHEGDIPAVKWVKSFDGSMKKDQEEKNAYLYKVLEEHATGSQKMSNKVSGGEPPKPFEGTVGGANVDTPNSPEAKEESKPKAEKETIRAYTQGEPTATEKPDPEEKALAEKPAPAPVAEKPAPAPVAESNAPAQTAGGDAPVKLPF